MLCISETRCSIENDIQYILSPMSAIEMTEQL